MLPSTFEENIDKSTVKNPEEYVERTAEGKGDEVWGRLEGDASAHAWQSTCVRTCACIRGCVRACKRMPVRVHEHKHTCKRACVNAYVRLVQPAHCL